MPLYAGTTPVLATPVEGPVPVWTEDIGTITATWTDPLGNVWELSNTSDDLGHFTRPEIAGWGARQYEFTVDAMPRGGDEIRAIRAKAARLTWPLHVWGDTHMQFLQRYRALKRAFMLTVHRGVPGVLRVARPDGSAREIECFYEDGWGGEPGENWVSANPALTLMCPDGYWRAIEPEIVEREYGVGSSFLSPFPTVSSSQVLGQTTIENVGDVEAWPDWTITGPATSVTATHTDTGYSFTLDYPLLAGQQATITTKRATARGPAGESIAGALNFPFAYLWPLEADTNNVEFAVAGAGVGTKIALSYVPRFEGA